MYGDWSDIRRKKRQRGEKLIGLHQWPRYSCDSINERKKMHHPNGYRSRFGIRNIRLNKQPWTSKKKHDRIKLIAVKLWMRCVNPCLGSKSMASWMRGPNVAPWSREDAMRRPNLFLCWQGKIESHQVRRRCKSHRQEQTRMGHYLFIRRSGH